MAISRPRIIQIASILLAALLLWLALRGVEFGRVWQDLKAAQWWWLVPMIVATLLSHWLRAWRWTLFLDELPAEDRETARIPVASAFAAIMVGYMANYAAPRLGEFVRTGNISTRFRLRFSSVLGTVAVERIVDMATLGLALLSVPLVLGDRLSAMSDLLASSMESWRTTLLAEWPLFVAVALALAVGSAIGYRRLRRAGNGRIRRILRSFVDGLRSVARTSRRGQLVGTTILMWICYGVMAWMPFIMFGFDQAYGVTFLHAWGLMLVGALGIVVPSPGGIGSYHFITIQALVLMFAFPTSEAATYAIISHAGQLVLYVVAGFVVMIFQGFKFSDLAVDTSNA